MKKTPFLLPSFVVAVLLSCSAFRAHAQKERAQSIQYLFPSNGASAITRETTIIIRPGDLLNVSTVKASLITVKGSFSGTHSGTFTVSDDKKTMIFKPTTLFTYSERVTVALHKGILTQKGVKVDSIYYYFTIQSQPKGKLFTNLTPSTGGAGKAVDIQQPNTPFVAGNVTSPYVNFPVLTPTTIDNPSPGSIFFSTYFNTTFPTTNLAYLAIVNDSGKPQFLRSNISEMTDFKVNANGLLTYYDVGKGMFFAMDSNYVIVDSFGCVNGYTADLHDIELLPNHHVLLMAYDTEKNVDLSQWIVGANPDAEVVGVVIQELDSSRDAIFNWRSFDSGNYQVTDMIEDPSNYLSSYLDEVHANAIQLDNDGNILLSARHLDEVTKISRDSAKIIWRWGGKHNQFTLLGDTLWFSHQHAVRRIDNGHITMMDNGNDHRYHDPNAQFFSRACEYALDEKAMTCTLVWSFGGRQHDMSEFMGYVQRLPNGNTFIGWGGMNNPAITEVRPDGTVAYEMTMAFPYMTYRAYRFPWNRPTALEGVGPHYASDVPLSVTLADAYPNPAASTSTVTLSLPSQMPADLRVYDALGHEVALLTDQLLSDGPHSFTFDGSKLCPGVYHCVARAGGQTVAKQIVLTR